MCAELPSIYFRAQAVSAMRFVFKVEIKNFGALHVFHLEIYGALLCSARIYVGISDMIVEFYNMIETQRWAGVIYSPPACNTSRREQIHGYQNKLNVILRMHH